MKGWLGGWSDMPTVRMCVVSFSVDLSWRVVAVGLAVEGTSKRYLPRQIAKECYGTGGGGRMVVVLERFLLLLLLCDCHLKGHIRFV